MNEALKTLSISTYVALDVGWQVKLRLAGELFQRAGVQAHFAKWYGRSEKTPLWVSRVIAPFQVGKWDIDSTVDVTFFEVGGVSVRFGIVCPDISIDELASLSSELSDNTSLATRAREVVGELVPIISTAISQPAKLDDQILVEDYTVFRGHLPALSLDQWTADKIAQVVQGVDYVLAPDRVAQVLSAKLQWSKDDLVLVDWRSAFILEREGAEENEVLEFVEETLEYANMQLVQLRVFGQHIENYVDWARGVLGAVWLSRGDRRRVRLLTADCAEFFTEVRSGLGLVEHQFVREVHRRAMERFEVEEIISRIREELEILNQINESLTADLHGLLSLWAEAIIIGLILFEIVLSFRGAH